MIAFIATIIGALFRRWFGGWEGVRRLYKLPVAFLLPFGICMIAGLSLYASLAVSFILGCAIAGWPFSFHAWGQRMGVSGPSLEACVMHMGGCYMAYTFLTSFALFLSEGDFFYFLYAPVGLFVPIGYIIGWYLLPKFKFWETSKDVWFIDGPPAIGELWLGAVIFGGLAAVAK